jgi:transcriptional regulator with XRE-family HTH domain
MGSAVPLITLARKGAALLYGVRETDAQLARLVGVSRAQAGRWRRGLATPSPERILKLQVLAQYAELRMLLDGEYRTHFK